MNTKNPESGPIRPYDTDAIPNYSHPSCADDEGKPPVISVCHDPFYSPENQEALKLSLEELRAGHVVVRNLEELRSME